MGKKNTARLFPEWHELGDTHRVNELMWQVLSGSRMCAHAPCQGCRVLAVTAYGGRLGGGPCRRSTGAVNLSQ
jgi:hypothetical protein